MISEHHYDRLIWEVSLHGVGDKVNRFFYGVGRCQPLEMLGKVPGVIDDFDALECILIMAFG